MKPRSCAKEFSGTLKEIVGTCVSVGCSVEGKPAKEIFGLVDAGELDTSEP